MSPRLPSRPPRARITPDEKRRLLAANSLFHDLSADVLSRIEGMTTVNTVAAGQHLFGPETSSDVLFLLKRGHVQIYRLNDDGKKLVVHDVKPGGFFGEMPLVGQALGGNFAVATQDSLVCAMSRQDILDLFRTQPAIAERILSHLVDRLNAAEERLETLAYQRLESRVASVLVREADPASGEIGGLSQQDLAEMVGASRESVTRILNTMSRTGLLELSRRRIRLADPQGVRDLLEEPA